MKRNVSIGNNKTINIIIYLSEERKRQEKINIFNKKLRVFERE